MDSEERKVNIFERASRRNLRIFPAFDKVLNVEDLWNVNIRDLNEIYIKINNELDKKSDKGLLTKKDDEIEDIRLRLAIIKHVYEVKLNENAKEIAELEREEKRKEIEEILSGANKLDTNSMILRNLIGVMKKFI
jgi:hypothetical protein